MTNYAGQQIICVHDYPTYIEDGYVCCENCDRVLGINC
jgi:hypothetical protein